MDVKAAAERMEVSPSLVYSLLAAGKLRHTRIGLGRGRIRITQEFIDEYLGRNTFAPSERRPEPPPRKLEHLRL